MPISPYIRALRERVGDMRLLLASVSATVRDEQGRLLLVRQRDGGAWSTPGGMIEPDETPADAVVRETWEETGLLVIPVRVMAVWGGPGFVVRYPNGDEVEFTAIVFECAAVGGALSCEGDETAELGWFDPADRPPLALEYPLAELLSGGHTVFQPPAGEAPGPA